MTIYEMMMNNNVHSDRYAMAAISYIFKAFGDDIRSKEFWPWGDKVQCPWTISKGTNIDIGEAELLLERARLKYDEETEASNINDKIYNEDTMKDSFAKNIKELQKRINKIQLNIGKVVKASDHTNTVSEQTTDTINKLNS